MNSRKGNSPFFIGLSILGIFVGLFLIFMGKSGNGLGAGLTLVVGIFVTLKEILDIFH